MLLHGPGFHGVLITSLLGIVAGQTAMCTTEVREEADAVDQVTTSAAVSVPELPTSFSVARESAGFSRASGFVRLGSENSPWTHSVFLQCQEFI